jgi:hypothetical protein
MSALLPKADSRNQVLNDRFMPRTDIKLVDARVSIASDSGMVEQQSHGETHWF